MEENANVKYSLPEIERRWLADAAKVDLGGVAPSVITDRYLTCGRLRLRRVVSPEGTVYKLCKKYPSEGVYGRITNIYLSEEEHEALAALDAVEVTKKRYRVGGGSLDVYPNGTAIFEVEFASEEEAGRFMPPAFVLSEVTGQAEFAGLALARACAGA